MVHYGLRCSSCRSENFRGLKYKSDRGSNYQLCQACFWCGHISSEHKNDVFKEYNTYKPTTGGGGGSLRSTTPSSLKKSMNCLQADVGNNTTTSSGRNSSMSNKKSSKKVSKFSNEPHTEKPMDITKSAQGKFFYLIQNLVTELKKSGFWKCRGEMGFFEAIKIQYYEKLTIKKIVHFR